MKSKIWKIKFIYLNLLMNKSHFVHGKQYPVNYKNKMQNLYYLYYSIYNTILLLTINVIV